MANANRSNDGDEDLLLLLSPLPNRSLHCAAAATMLSSPKHTLFYPLVYVCEAERLDKRKKAAPEREVKGVCGGGNCGKGFYILVTSTSNTNNLLVSRPSRPSSNRTFVPSKSRLAVATIGREVFCKRRRVSAKPIPREAGVVKFHPPPGRGAMFFLLFWGKERGWRGVVC